MTGPLRTGKPKATARRQALSKSPPRIAPSRLRQRLMASTMLQPLAKGALAVWAEADAGAVRLLLWDTLRGLEIDTCFFP